MGYLLPRQKKSFDSIRLARRELGWSESLCIACQSKEEEDDLIDGELPCKKGYCKYFKGAEDALAIGHPHGWLSVWGLTNAEGLCHKVIALSPLDGEGLPSAQAYPWVVGSANCSEEEFQEFLLGVLMDERKRTINLRKK